MLNNIFLQINKIFCKESDTNPKDQINCTNEPYMDPSLKDQINYKIIGIDIASQNKSLSFNGNYKEAEKIFMELKDFQVMFSLELFSINDKFMKFNNMFLQLWLNSVSQKEIRFAVEAVFNLFIPIENNISKKFFDAVLEKQTISNVMTLEERLIYLKALQINKFRLEAVKKELKRLMQKKTVDEIIDFIVDNLIFSIFYYDYSDVENAISKFTERGIEYCPTIVYIRNVPREVNQFSQIISKKTNLSYHNMEFFIRVFILQSVLYFYEVLLSLVDFEI